jgi:alanine racemase
MDTSHLKVWVEISKSAIEHNIQQMRRLLKPETQLWSVVKSNAYGHGIYTFSPLAQKAGVDGFCVDSVIEGMSLRRGGIRKPILALGPTLPALYRTAYASDTAITVSTRESLEELATIKRCPDIHLKVDTGMHRQGFSVNELPEIFEFCKQHTLPIVGIYSHFAASKNPADTTFNEKQLAEFTTAIALAEASGYTTLVKHIAATPATLLDSKYHQDLVRIGAGLYGIYPSQQLKNAFKTDLPLQPVLSLKARISELKRVKAGETVGYERSEQLSRDSTLAIIPIGYWHGVPRAASKTAHVLIAGTRCKVLGLISMDLMVVDATGLDAKVGQLVTLIGNDGAESIGADELAAAAQTTPQELLSRLNPLIERIVV